MSSWVARAHEGPLLVLLIQRGLRNQLSSSNLQYSPRARVTRCWRSAQFVRRVAEV